MNEREQEPLSHGEPDEVTLLLGELKEVDPPADLAGSVMARISSEAPQRAWRVEPVPVRGGRVMAKKVLWSVMGAAAAVLIVLRMAGYPPASEGTEGTIGAAQRYQAQQISDADVKLTDAQLQAFMQSDAFHALISDKAARQALANKDLQKALANDGLRQVLASDDLRQALANDALRQALASDELRQALASDTARQALKNDALRQALASDAVRQALANDALRQALANDGLRQALANDALRQALASDQLRQAVGAPGFAAALDAAATGAVAN
jgi:hypothetical protein